MFVNEYVMTRKRYDRWATPKFWRVRTFYLWIIIFLFGVFGCVYFEKAGAAPRWQTLGAFLIFVAVYRGVFFKWMHADKTFRVTRTQYFGGKDWNCKVIIRDKQISLHINGKSNNTVDWKEITKFEEAKTYFKLSTDGVEGVMLEKDGFTEGDADSFRQWMLDNHPDIPHGPIAPAFNK